MYDIPQYTHLKNEVFLVFCIVSMYLISLKFVNTYGMMIRGSHFNYINKTYSCPGKVGPELHIKETFFPHYCEAAQLPSIRATCLFLPHFNPSSILITIFCGGLHLLLAFFQSVLKTIGSLYVYIKLKGNL